MKVLGYGFLIIIAFLLSVPNVAAETYAPGAFDFTTLNSDMILEAKHIVVGEVIDVSFVFTPPGYFDSFSFVTIRVDLDIKQEIVRQEQKETANNAKRRNKKNPTVTLAQLGGPSPDGDYVKIAGLRTLKTGDRVFLRLVPIVDPPLLEHDGQRSDVTVLKYGCRYSLTQEKGKALDETVIKHGWQGMDVTISQMARITRATLKQPKRMKALELRVHALGRPRPVLNASGHLQMPPDARLNIVMDEVATVEAELGLSALKILDK
jgi:hypothetical protein